MLGLSKVTVSRKFKFQHLNKSRLCINRFLFIIIAIGVCDNSAAEAPTYGAECEAFRTCARCTASATTACRWSFPDQKCFSGDRGPPPVAVATTAADCPVFRSGGDTDRVTTTVVADGGGPAPEGFTRFLANSSRVTCQVNEHDYDGLVDVDNGTTIVCVRATEDDGPAPGFCTWPSTVAYLAFVVDDGPPLVFDDARDHYVPLYPPSCGQACPHDNASCAACQWDDDRYRYYCAWCAARGECRSYHACDRRRLADLRYADDDSVESVRLDDRCTGGVGPFSPTDGPWAGGTVLSVAVPGRDVLLWDEAGQNVTVTVAGRDCAGPRWFENTVVCTVSPAPLWYDGDVGPEAATAGPVVLTVGDSPEVVVRSTTSFRFVGRPEQPDTAAVPAWWPPSTKNPPYGPTTDADQKVHDSASGGDAFRVRGGGSSGLLGVVCLMCLRRRVLP